MYNNIVLFIYFQQLMIWQIGCDRGRYSFELVLVYSNVFNPDLGLPIWPLEMVKGYPPQSLKQIHHYIRHYS